MHVIIINPNASEAMTRAMLATARTAAPHLHIDGWTSHKGPPSIQGREDGMAAVPPLLELVRKAAADGADAVIIGCFDDTGLAEANAMVDIPVIGIGQASFHLAALKAHRFSVVTTLAVSIPIIEENIATHGFSHLSAPVRASNVPVLELEADPDAAHRLIIAEAQAAVDRDGATCVILGCAGMTELAAALRNGLRVEVIDAVEAAVVLTAATLATGR